MRLVDYLRGRRVVLFSPLSPDQVRQRINAATGSLLNPFGQGVLGWAGLGRMRLLYIRRRFYRHQWEPVLAGRIGEAGSGSRLDVKYRAPIWIYFFMPIWYFALAGIALEMATGNAPLLAAALLVGFGSVPILSILAFAHDELQALLAFLQSELGAAMDAGG